MSVIDYKNIKAFKEQLCSYIRELIDVFNLSGYNEISDNPVQELIKTQNHLDNQELRFLVIGNTASGKTSLLNGLFGKPLLPCRSIFNEVKYAEKERVVLTPKPGKWKNGDAPFEIQVSELDKYTRLEHTADGAKESPFHCAYIEYPLAICKDGIVFIDTPGFYDQASYRDVVDYYLPMADVIIYCMSSFAAYSSTDRDKIDYLRAMGYKSIIFVLTNYNRLVEDDEMMGTHDADDLRNYMYNKLAPLTDLGKSGIFFVDSYAAIKGKMKNDIELLRISNFPNVEEKIKQIANERGRIKLIRSLYQVKAINKCVGKYLRDKMDIARKDYDTFVNNLVEAECALMAARQITENIERYIENMIYDISHGAKDQGQLFLMSILIPSIDSWVNDYDPDNISIFHLKSSVSRYIEAHLDNLTSKMSRSFEKWCCESLEKEYIVSWFEKFYIDQHDNLVQYEENLSRVRNILNLPSEGDDIRNVTISPIEDNFGNYLFIRDLFWEANVGGNPGIRTSLIATILAFLGGATLTIPAIKREIKKRIIIRVKELLSASDKRAEFGENIESFVKSSLGYNIKDKIHKELQMPIDEIKNLVEQAKIDKEKDKAEQSRERTKLKQILQKQKEIENSLDSILKAMNT